MDHQAPEQPVPVPEPPVSVPEHPVAPTTLSGPLADLPVRAADAVDNLVVAVHDRFIRPVILAARAVVFGLLIFTMSIVLAVLISVSLVRLLTVYVFDGRVWASYLLLGGIFTVGGLVLWSRRTAAVDGVSEPGA